MGFFSNTPATSGGAIVSRSVVKPVQKPAPRTNGSTEAPAGAASVPRPSSSLVGPRKLTKPSPSSNIPRASPAAVSSKTSNGSRSTLHPSASTPSRPPKALGHSATSSRSSTPLKKRRDPSPIRSESESDSSSSDRRTGTQRKPRSDRIPSAKRARNSLSSLSASATPGTGTPQPTSSPGQGRALWCLDKVDARGEWGRGWTGFVSSEEVVRGDVRGWAGGKGEGAGNAKYTAYFPQEGFGVREDGTMPTVDVLYPATGCKERFVLLVPVSGREYNPIAELRSMLRLVLEHYIPPSHQSIFGSLTDSLVESSFRIAPPTPFVPTSSDAAPIEGPTAAMTSADGVVPDTITSVGAGVDSAPALLPDTSIDPFTLAVSAPPTPSGLEAMHREPIADAIRRALAPNKRDGPGLLRAIERYNNAMEALQQSGEMGAWLALRSRSISGKEWCGLVNNVNEMAYARVVGPYSHELEHHPKHPDEVAKAISAKEDAYGELRHNFMSQIINHTKLSPSSTFVDLGSGVGNCVMQTALQAGCESYGVELLPVPSHCARLQLQEVRRRWAMWGLNGNLDVALAEGDMRGNATVARWLAKADVVLVNNEVFPPALNDDLKNMFLDLKEGAKIVSLKPFVNEGFRMNESNCDSFDAIVKLTTHTYYPDWVSWKGDSGKYFVQTIDRAPRRRFEEDMLAGRRRR